MKKFSDKTKKRIRVLVIAMLPLLIITLVFGLPFYVAVLFYLAAFFVSIFIYYPNYLAILGNINYIRGNEKTARRLLKAAIAKNTKSPVAHHNYGLMLMRDGEGEAALGVLNKSLALNPKVMTEKKVRLAIGSCYWVMKDIESAIATLEDMRERYEYVNAHVLASLGYMYFLNGDRERALTLTEKAVEDSPDYAAAWDNLGQIYFKDNDFNKAGEAFLKAISFKDDLADSNYYLGLIAEAGGDTEAARGYFEKAAGAKITALNTVTREQIEEKLNAVLNKRPGAAGINEKSETRGGGGASADGQSNAAV